MLPLLLLLASSGCQVQVSLYYSILEQKICTRMQSEMNDEMHKCARIAGSLASKEEPIASRRLGEPSVAAAALKRRRCEFVL